MTLSSSQFFSPTKPSKIFIYFQNSYFCILLIKHTWWKTIIFFFTFFFFKSSLTFFTNHFPIPQAKKSNPSWRDMMSSHCKYEVGMWFRTKKINIRISSISISNISFVGVKKIQELPRKPLKNTINF